MIARISRHAMSDFPFIPECQLAFSPALAQTIGLEEAILLQHLGDLFRHRITERRDGREWLCIERERLLTSLPFWSATDLQRISRSLADKGIILVESPRPPDPDTLIFAIDEPAAKIRPLSQHPRSVGGDAPANRRTRRPAGASRVGADWSPAEDTLKWLTLNHSIPRGYALDQLEDFVFYWRERGEARFAWENEFRQHVLGRWRRSEQARAERFTRPAVGLEEDWRPSADALEILERSNINRTFIDDAVPEFVLYWRERNPREKALNSKFIQHVRLQWERYRSTLIHDTKPRRIPANWQPKEDVFDILRMSHIDAAFARELVPEFVMYWSDSNQLHNSWNTKFLQHVKYKWAQRNELDPHGGQQNTHSAGRTRDRSLAEDLTDRSWAH